LIGLLAWDLPLQASFDLPNVIARGTDVGGEVAKLAPQVASGLAERGVTVKAGRGEESGLHGIAVRENVVEGAADKRREGVWRER
jgi:gamma-glutamyltranspeptidase/glutathione hydrolase